MSSAHHLTTIAILTNALTILSAIFLLLLFYCYFFKFRRTDAPHSSAASSSSSSSYGLDPAVLRSLPVSVFHDDGVAQDDEDTSSTLTTAIECAVCISVIADGEKYRVLPACGHSFHLDCVDMWFHSHSTCPLCRSSVGPTTSTSSYYYYSTDLPNLPTNVLFWGNLDRVTTGASPSGSRNDDGGEDVAFDSLDGGWPASARRFLGTKNEGKVVAFSCGGRRSGSGSGRGDIERGLLS